MTVLLLLLCAANTPAEAYQNAGRAYHDGRYEEAAELYEALAREPEAGANVLYNLGNARLRLGQVGRAIAAYRAAERASPRDAELAANLAYARTRVADVLEPAGPSPIVRTVLFWLYALSPAELVWLGALTWLVAWVALAIQRWRRRTKGLAVVLVGVAVVLGASGFWRYAAPLRVAVITEASVIARAGRDPESVARFELHEGAEVGLVAADESWLRIALPDGTEGWIPATVAQLVRM